MNSRNNFILQSFNELKTRMIDHFPFDQSPLNEEEADFFDKLDQVIIRIQQKDVNYSFEAQDILARFIRCYPNLVPLMRRELLWFLGGECLHYLGDEEVALFQDLEERLYQLEQQNDEINIDKEIELLRAEYHSQSSTQH